MARMYPNIFTGDMTSTAEGRLYVLFRDELDDSYLVFSNVRWPSRGEQANHSSEADFVIVHPDKGVLVLEVKRGLLQYEAQTKSWTSGDRRGTSHHVMSPFEQARHNMFQLLDSVKVFLQEHDMENYVLSLSKYVGYAVAFPDNITDKSLLEPFTAPEIVLDVTDLSHIRQWTERAMEYWRHFYSLVRIRILEDPLTVSNLNIIISSLTELSTKYWLIAKGRFADLIEYTQTHNSRFAEEANALVTRISYNSPFNMDWKVDISAPSVAEALVKTIDGVAQRGERLEKAQLENRAKVQEIETNERKADHDNQMAQLAQREQQLKLEERRLEIMEKQLDIQKKSIEHAMEMAGKMVDLLHPGADPATRAMAIQTVLTDIFRLQGSNGLALPAPQENQTTPKQN